MTRLRPGMSERRVWTEQGSAVLTDAVDAFQATFAERLVVAYALGDCG